MNGNDIGFYHNSLIKKNYKSLCSYVMKYCEKSFFYRINDFLGMVSGSAQKPNSLFFSEVQKNIYVENRQIAEYDIYNIVYFISIGAQAY